MFAAYKKGQLLVMSVKMDHSLKVFGELQPNSWLIRQAVKSSVKNHMPEFFVERLQLVLMEWPLLAELVLQDYSESLDRAT